MANIDLLQTAKTNLLTQLSTITLTPKINYSLDGQSISWLEYQRFILEEITRINLLIQIEGGVLFQETQAWSW